jgi:hypothetical protein
MEVYLLSGLALTRKTSAKIIKTIVNEVTMRTISLPINTKLLHQPMCVLVSLCSVLFSRPHVPSGRDRRRRPSFRLISRGRLFWAVLVLVLSTAILVNAGTFGTRCQRTYQNGWLPTLDYMYDRCDGFNNRMADNNTQTFYFSLNNGAGFDGSDGSTAAGGVDTVDIFYVGTHGGANATDARLALKPVQTRTFSSTWRFGDNSRPISILSQYACKTLTIDSNAFARWVNAFKGGLYLATGSHDKVYDGWTTDETGEDYADNLTHGMTVKWAWFDGNQDWYQDQDVAIYASSSGPLDECLNRLNSMTGQNINSFPRFRNGKMNRICASWITDF